MTLKRALIYLFIFLFGLLVISFTTFWTFTHPEKLEFGGNLNQDLGPLNLKPEEVQITTQDGLQLSAWYIPAKQETQTAVILLHGYPTNKKDLAGMASLISLNFNTLLLDFRYFGDSEGKVTTFGNQEKLDVMAAAQYLKARGNEKIGVFGYSLGGASAILAAEESQIDALVSLSSFADLKDVADFPFRRMWILKKPMTYLTTFWYKLFFGDIPNPAQAAKNLKIPIFLIHCQKDEIVPFSQALKLQEALKENPNAEYYFLENCYHNDPPLDFEFRARAFFKEHLN